MKINSTFKLSGSIAGIFILFAICMAPTVFAQSNEELAKEVVNPLTSMTLVPFQFNYDSNIGSVDDGDRFSLNIQPLWSFSINNDWNIISRTILPVIIQNDVFPEAGSQSGLGDVLQSLFFSPNAAVRGWIWGAGPVLRCSGVSGDHC